MKLIVGLGNPGAEYNRTRHNIGFEVIEQIAEKLGWVSPGQFDQMARSRFDSLIFDGVLNRSDGPDEKLILVKPMTYMNLSGSAVRAVMDFHRIAPHDVLIVLDELALPVGKIRLRASGSDGGHNGLKDIRRALGTDQYPRLRIGIDSPPGQQPARDYVLQRFTSDQRAIIDQTLPKAAGCCLTWLDKGITFAMNQFNG